MKNRQEINRIRLNGKNNHTIKNRFDTLFNLLEKNNILYIFNIIRIQMNIKIPFILNQYYLYYNMLNLNHI